MNVKIGAKIKSLRKRDNVTQEKLAEVLGLTSQAVSKWESESGYPDIEYITPIANFFNVTIDSLFDHDSAEKLKQIDDYCTKANRMFPQERIDTMRQALAEFPAEEKLLFILAEALYCKWRNARFKVIEDDDGNKKYVESDEWKEATAIFEELLVSSVDDSIRAQCRWHLAMIYGARNEKDKLMRIAEMCDPASKSREMVLAYAFPRGYKEREMYQKEAVLRLLNSFTSILNQISHSKANLFINHNQDIADEIGFECTDIQIDIYEKINKYVFNNQAFINHNGGCHIGSKVIVGLYTSYALSLIVHQRFDEAYEKLENAYKFAKDYDELVKKGKHIAEHIVEPRAGECDELLLPELLETLISKHSIGIPHDPQLCNDIRFTELVSRIEADLMSDEYQS